MHNMVEMIWPKFWNYFFASSSGRKICNKKIAANFFVCTS